MYKIMIIEDDSTICKIIEENLQKWGYNPLIVKDFSQVLLAFTSFQPHLVLMDINLPNFDGYYWCGKIREISDVPIIFISSRDSDGDKIRAITQGGDDYIEKPFSMDLLVAKVQAVMRRTYSYGDNTLNIQQYKEMILDMEHLKLICGEEEISLTPNECKMLSLLFRNHNKIVSRTRMMKVLWDDESFVDDNTLTVNVNRLRKKLDRLGRNDIIVTVKGEGYRLS